MAGPEQRLNPEERANLVAYIDGELTDAESRVIATKLTQSPTARRELESLKQTWELLNHLPRPEASAEFPDRTRSVISGLQARQGRWRESAEVWTGRGLRAAIAAVVGAALVAAGFLLSHWAWTDPAERLARDLSLAERLDEYQEVGSFEFLDELARTKEFGSVTR